MRGAWIEIIMIFLYPKPFWSLPMRGAWIEIIEDLSVAEYIHVAPHAGSVD